MKYNNEIVQKIKENGFGIIRKRQVILSPEEVSEFYKEHYGKPWFPQFVIKMSNKPMLALCISKCNAVDDFKTLIGPPKVSDARKLYPLSLRAIYGLKGDKSTNAIHGSKTLAKAEEELHFFFARMITKPIRAESLNLNFLKEQVNSVILEGLSEVCRIKPEDPVIWFANWLLENNPKKPKMPPEISHCPYTLDELLPN
ncbi:hypothetical protein AAG570_003763 [Ranatra chinensis]|uniref:Nucleoside diphosphate kinase-like domain-containing protein n=1 Tax=Ranatra chinensis TaxID=642074 RepID=A0ABD0Y4M5_9HEMI